MKSSRRFLKLTVVFAVLHGAAFLASFLISFSGTMYRFDHPEVPETLLEKICTVLSAILIEPYGGLTGSLGYNNRILDLTGMLLNSLLWGTAFSMMFILLKRTRSRSVGF